MIDIELLTDLFNLLDPLNVVYNGFPLDEYRYEIDELSKDIKNNPTITPELIGSKIYHSEDWVTLEKCILLGKLYLQILNVVNKNEYHSLIENILNMWDPFYKDDEIPKQTNYRPYAKKIISHKKNNRELTLGYMKKLLYNNKNNTLDFRDISVNVFIKLINRSIKEKIKTEK